MGTTVPYPEYTTPPILPPMPTAIGAEGNGYSDSLASLSTRPSRQNSLNHPSTGVEGHRRNMSGLEYNGSFGAGEMRGATGLPNGLSHGLNGYSTQQGQNQNPGNVAGNTNHYGYEHTASNPEMNQNGITQTGMLIKTEESNSAPYGRPAPPAVNGLSNASDSGSRWPGSFNPDQSEGFMASSMASGPPSNEKSGDLTDNNL